MPVSTMIGTAQKLYSLEFLETQEMNFRDSLQDSKCDILNIFTRTFFGLRKISFSLLTLSFSRNIFTPGPSDVLQNLPFFSNAKTQQSRLSDSSKHRLHEKFLLLSVLL